MTRDTAGFVLLAAIVLGVGIAIGVGAAGLVGPFAPTDDGDPQPSALDFDDEPEMATFQSSEEFESYFQADNQRAGQYLVGTAGLQADGDDSAGSAEDDGAELESTTDEAAADSEHSETNVQEERLDEPDVVKTDGESVYYSGHRFQRGDGETTILSVDDPAEPAVVSSIPAAGEMLLVEDEEMLVIFEPSSDQVRGYDVSEPEDPVRAWDEPLNASLQTARLYDGSLYLVLVDRPDMGSCTLRPFAAEEIACTDIHRPDSQANADAVYTAIRVDPTTGETEDTASVVGSVHDSATYVSENAMYLSYTRSTSNYELMLGYMSGPGSEHLDESAVERLEYIESLDISDQAKFTELQIVIEEWLERLDEEERRAAHEELYDGLREYSEEHQRDLTRTGIVRIGIDGDFDVTASGEVPGHPLNQWSMDEHENHLRIATTIPGVQGTDSKNDVYVLDEDLEITGSVEGLGVTERIYAVRFEGDEGYVVTFRQIDPFYTLDLADPSDPVMEGELKIPGFSEYLHPLDEDEELILGVGMEDRQVKFSTFDVSDRENPTEVDAVILEDERFSEVNENHRAFLHDDRHGVFFVPAQEASYVYSYDDGELTEEATVDIGGPGVRAMYFDDYLYVIGPDKLVVFDETTWEVENEIDLS